MLSELGRRLRMLFRRNQFDADLDEEMRLHCELREQEEISRGASQFEARYAVRRRFGNDLALREESRDMWGWDWLENFLQDVGYAVRILLKNPGFTGVAILMLALGIGANAAIFSVVNAVLLRAFPYRNSSQLVMVFWNNPAWGQDRIPLCAADFEDWKAGNHAFIQPSVFGTNDYDFTGGEEPRQIRGAVVAPGFFSVLGVEPVLGRNFLPEEQKAGGPLAVMVSHDFWVRFLGGRTNVLKQNITLNGQTYVVAGVMPVSFRFPDERIELWEPLRLEPPTRRGPYFLRGLARLSPGVSLRQARADMEIINQRIRQQTGEKDTGVRFNVLPLRTYLVGDVQPVLLVLMVVVGFVLLIAVANLANLMLVKSLARQREMAMRVALGAGRARLIRQLLTEGVVLAGLGAGLGLLLAYGTGRLFVALSPQGVPRLDEVNMDGQVLGFTLAVGVLSSLCFGLAPAWQAFKLDLNDTLKQGGMRGVVSSYGRLRSSLVVAELGLALMLLIGATLMLSSFLRLNQVNAGFDPQRLLTAEISMPDFRYSTGAQAGNFYHELLNRVSALPGVESAAVASGLPPNLMQIQDTFTIRERPTPTGEDDPIADFLFISPDYFRSLGVPLLQGRTFSDADRDGAPLTVIINQTLARRFFPGEDPVGKLLRQNRGNPWMQIVGVVGDVRYAGLDAIPDPSLYVPYQQHAWAGAYLVVRARQGALALVPSVRNAVWSVDKDLPVTDVMTAEQRMDQSVSTPRFRTLLVSIFALLALLLAAIGTYGVVCYSTAQRTREMGIRVALGARKMEIFRLVVGQALALSLAGTAVGLAGAFALTRFMKNLLFGVKPVDPMIFGGVSVFLSISALVASLIPARRATKVDPLVALRYE